MAVPFGSPVFCCYYRADLLEKLGRKPPQTWTEYEELAKLLRRTQKPAGGAAWCGTIEPLVPGWAGLVLLARAAAYAKHRDNYSALFNIETMEPLVAGPPVRSRAGRIRRRGQTRPGRSARLRSGGGPGRVLEGAMRHGARLADGRETGEDGEERRKRNGNYPRQSRSAHSRGLRRIARRHRASSTSAANVWDTRADDDDPRVPLLAIAGRLGVVGAKSGHARRGFSVALVALRQPPESAGERGQSGHDAVLRSRT